MIEVKERLEHLLSQLEGEIDILQLKAHSRAREASDGKSQREYYPERAGQGDSRRSSAR